MSLWIEPVSDDTSESDDERPSIDNGWSQTVFLLAKVGGLGWFIAGTIALGTASGYWLDRLFGTAPVLLIAGVVMGSVVAFAGLTRIVAFFGKDSLQNYEIKDENKKDGQNGETA